MQQIRETLILLMVTFVSYLISVSGASAFLPQLFAILAITFLVLNHLNISNYYLIFGIISLIVFFTDGLGSPFFFLIYFILFISALLYHPVTSLAYSLILIIFLGHTLNSMDSLYTLLSLTLISPLVWLVSRKSESESKTREVIATDETDVLLWLNLKFKTGITTILDLTSQLSTTSLTYSQKEQVKKIRTSAHSLLNSSQKLTEEIGSDPLHES